jgi:phosphatidylserine/phosphatidylglycerophosphate/cardiolipin synthase-like enzyme
MSQLPHSPKPKGRFAGALLAAAVGFGGGVAVDRAIEAPSAPVAYFSPNGGCTEAIVKAIDAASTEIRVQAYVFTSADIANALIRAQQRKPPVKVYLLIDKNHDTKKNDQTLRLIQADIETRIEDYGSGIAHDKVVIIDKRKVITGSFNYTVAAEQLNGENLLVLQQPQLTARYLDNWEKHWTHPTTLQFMSRPPLLDPIAPEVAIQRAGQLCHVRMRVATAKSVHGIVYLNYLDPYNR